MPTATRSSNTPIAQLAADWRSVARSPAAIDALEQVAARDSLLDELVHGSERVVACPSPFDLVEHLRQASGRRQREDAAAVIRILLREASLDPFVARTLVQALMPGLIAIATKLQWGRGGAWSDGEEFFSDLVSTTWETISEWSGQDRPYAVLDLLSAIRCRLRRQLLRAKAGRSQMHPIDGELGNSLRARPETYLEELTRTLIDLWDQGMNDEELQVLYAHHVLGFSISELSTVTGRDRRVLYSRRDRGQRRLYA